MPLYAASEAIKNYANGSSRYDVLFRSSITMNTQIGRFYADGVLLAEAVTRYNLSAAWAPVIRLLHLKDRARLLLGRNSRPAYTVLRPELARTLNGPSCPGWK